MDSLIEIQIFIIRTFNIDYQWIAKITDIELLKDLTCNQLFDIINNTLTKSISECNISGLGEKTIHKLHSSGVYNKSVFDKLIKQKSKKKPNNIKGKQWNKKGKKKAVSSWYLQLFAITIFVILL